MEIFVVLWSRTEEGKKKIESTHSTYRKAKQEAKLSALAKGGWFSIGVFNLYQLVNIGTQ